MGATQREIKDFSRFMSKNFTKYFKIKNNPRHDRGNG